MNILPGEPVPPGFEDEINRVAEIQKAIDQYKGNALIGLEYTIELYEDDRNEPGYFCVLCDKRGDPRTIMQHWTSFNHRMKYLEKHYPTAVREINPVKYKPNSNSIMIMVVQKLAEAIEDHNGRLPLSVCQVDEFRRQKTSMMNEVNAKFHYDEHNGPNFVNVIDRRLWEKNGPAKKETLTITLKNSKRPSVDSKAGSNAQHRDSLDEISSDSDAQEPKKQKKREQSPAFRILPRVRRSPPFEEDRSEKKLPTPKELSMQASHIAQERYKWEKYRCTLEHQLNIMEKQQREYDITPEKHPSYADEWKKFWNRRYKELQVEGKVDPNKYDYKPEWIESWKKIKNQLFNDEVEKKKKETKLRVGLPEDAEEKVEQLKEKYKVKVPRTVAPSVDTGKEDSKNRRAHPQGDVIDISDDEEISTRPPRRISRSRSRSRSPRRPRSSRRSRSRSRSRSNSRHSPRHSYTRSRSRRRSDSRSRSPIIDDYERKLYHPRHSASRSAYPPPAIELDYYGGGGGGHPPMPYSRSRYHGGPPGPVPYYGGPTKTGYRVMNPHDYPKYERSPSPGKTKGSAPPSSLSGKRSVEPEVEPEDDGPLTVVAVLRLLTALEEHLGSLGPKVVDLLGKALALEKVKANSADDLLLNEDHCVFFETIKEKLKGLLLADMLDDAQKVRAVKRAVKNIAAVVHQANDRGKEIAKKSNADAGSNSAGSDVRSNQPARKGDFANLPFDRQMISTKLAAELVMNGREDVSTDDMNKLIYLFIAMVKLSKAKVELDGKSMTAREVLAQVSGVPVSPLTDTQMQALSALPAIVDEFFDKEAAVAAAVAVASSSSVLGIDTTVGSAGGGGASRIGEEEEEEDGSNDTGDKTISNDIGNSMLESLTDSDLQTLLQNFKHLSTEEQHHLVAHLKKLETADPLRVEKLRKYVNVTDFTGDGPSTSASSSSMVATAAAKIREESMSSGNSNSQSRRLDESPAAPGTTSTVERAVEEISSRVSSNRRGVNVTNPNKFSLDDDDEDDDYNFEDVFKAASSNVNRLSAESKTKNDGKTVESSTKPPSIVPSPSSSNSLTFNPAGLNISLSETQNIIANLMGSLQQSNANSSSKQEKTTANPPSGTKPIPAIQRSNHQSTQQKKAGPVSQSQQQQQPPPGMNVPFYQQQQQPPYAPGTDMGAYNQMAASNMMGNPQGAGYYNAMATGYGYPAAGGYGSQWNAGPSGAPQMAPYANMPNFMPQQQPQQQPQPPMGYNMYGHGGQ